MNRRAILAAIGLGTILVVGLACGNGQPTDTPGPAVPAQAAGVAPTEPAPPPILSAGFPAARPATPPIAPVAAPAPAGIQGREVPVPEPAPMPAAVAVVPAPVMAGGSGPQLLQAGGSQAGIWVTGEGSMSLEPDLALVNIGVEASAKTVAEARDQAATAMAAILIAVKAQGLDDRDVQTRSFNIVPQYEYPEVVELGRSTRKQVLRRVPCQQHGQHQDQGAERRRADYRRRGQRRWGCYSHQWSELHRRGPQAADDGPSESGRGGRPGQGPAVRRPHRRGGRQAGVHKRGRWWRAGAASDRRCDHGGEGCCGAADLHQRRRAGAETLGPGRVRDPVAPVALPFQSSRPVPPLVAAPRGGCYNSP